jgi:gamma-glutamyl-gamma-aminobutyrate hydrolase PuuD
MDKFIAVSQRVDYVMARSESRDALDQRLTGWVTALGCLPLPVPNTLGDDLARWLVAMQPAAILLSGGNDVGDSLERDRTETLLLQHAEYAGLPVLGICRGMQMLAHYAGATLAPVNGHASTHHALHGHEVACGTLPAQVRSFHNWGLPACPPGYVVLATAPDGSIEAMRHRDLRWEGWMWHPEREVSFGEIELARAKQLLTGGR